jgi:HD-GYP domain-containing protein (c-di-GMP phosphodiesterase class II)
LYKAARLTEGEVAELREHVDRGVALLEPVGGSLRRVILIILAHHDKFDGTWALSSWRTTDQFARIAKKD